ncbi:S8 family serine peptidase [Angustibacter peucedani]
MRRSRPLLLTGVALASALAGLAAVPASAAPGGSTSGSTSGSTGPASRLHVQPPRWDRRGPSLTAAPGDLLAHARAGGSVRVVTLTSDDGRPRVAVSTATSRAAAEALLRAAQRRPDAVGVAVDTRVHALDVSDDTYRSTQWALDRLHAEDVWTSSRGAGVVVGVVDTGVSAAHPDLAGDVLTGPSNGTDYVLAGGDGTADGNGHGTHVGGIIAAVAGNGIGVAGLAPDAKVLPVRALDAHGDGWSSDVAAGIVHAVDHGATVVNLSLGGDTPDDVTAAAVQYARDHDVVVLAAAGNEKLEGNPVEYPAAYPGVIGVAATDSSDRVAVFSNTGSTVDVAAPGVGILSTVPGGYGSKSGTSMATPYVAAVAALVRSADPTLTAPQVAQVLQGTAHDLGPVGPDNSFGAGLVDPAAAVCAALRCDGPDLPPLPRASTATSVSRSASSVSYGQTLTITARLVGSRSGSGLSHAPVRLCRKVAPARSYTCWGATTDSSGRVVYRATGRATTSLYATYAGSTTALASHSPTTTVGVHARISTRSGRGTFTATVVPYVRQRVVLYRHASSGWVAVTSRTASSRGTASFTGLRAATYQVRVAASSTLLATTSGSRRVS